MRNDPDGYAPRNEQIRTWRCSLASNPHPPPTPGTTSRSRPRSSGTRSSARCPARTRTP
jgi:hypothetical protein